MHRFSRFFINMVSKKTKIPYNGLYKKFKDFVKRDVPHCAVEVPFEPNATAIVTQTGGTTGNPKGVELYGPRMRQIPKTKWFRKR